MRNKHFTPGIVSMMKKNVCLFLILWLMPIFCFAEDTLIFNGRVSVSVTADNLNVKNEIESNISRELRSLGDIIVTHDQPGWLLSIVAKETTNQRGDKTGYAISTTVLEPFQRKYMLDAVNVDDKTKDLLFKGTANLYYYINQWISLGGPDDLKNMCNSLVAKFDSENLKPSRDLKQTLEKLKGKIREKK
jgi:hypothetical protein